MSRNYYRCGICGGLHPWVQNQDCRHGERFSTPDELPAGSRVYSWTARMEADQGRDPDRVEYLREQVAAECISWDELHELQVMGAEGRIDPDDAELLEAAGVPESVAAPVVNASGDQLCILIFVNDDATFDFVGPFSSNPEATEYARNWTGSDDWRIAPIDPPAMETPASVRRKVASEEWESFGETKLLDALEQAERVIRHAAQESKGRVRKEIVGGWRHHAAQLRAIIDSIKALA